MSRYLDQLETRVTTLGLGAKPNIQQSNGGFASPREAGHRPICTLASGPAAGVIGAVDLSRRAGYRDLITFDVGGTSTDVCLIEDGVPLLAREREVAGYPVRFPMIDVHSVGAGGGSIAWIDDGGALRVGPQSAGADPGPACYGRGGGLPTVTDANLVLGRLDAGVPLAGSVRLDAKAARRAVATVADGFASVRAAAAGIVAVANQEMVRAIRVVSVERGHDPRGFELIAFGGAGPLHACEVAEELGMRSVRVPAASGVLSALGIAAGERRRDAVRSVMRRLEELTRSQIRSQVPWPQAERGSERWAAADLRYAGQGFELEVDLEPLATLAERFHERHAERYGHEQRGTPIELVNLRAASTAAGPALELVRAPRRRPVPGPATLHLDGATLWVAPGWTARAAGDGGWRVTR